ncbi:MAG TPA: hypothetical protein VN725_00620 [Rhodanobacteraceae bacterium]|nr:hypothetical protein [Rhodanobacteraceae bacterium]
MRRIGRCLLGVLVFSSALAVSGCVVVPRRRPPPPPPPACWWVPGHYNAHGYWVPAHCRP